MTNISDKVPTSFEAGMKELELIVEKMEQGQVALEDAVKLYERGVILQRFCNEKLEKARLSLEKLSQDANGNITPEAISAAN